MTATATSAAKYAAFTSKLTRLAADAETELARFAQNLEENPRYAFEWADKAVFASRMIVLTVKWAEVADRLENRMGKPFTALATSLTESLVMSLGSTGTGMTAVTCQAETAALGKLVDFANDLIKWED